MKEPVSDCWVEITISVSKSGNKMRRENDRFNEKGLNELVNIG